MKQMISRNGLVIAFAVAMMASLTAAASADDHACSVSRAAGKWSFTDNGTVLGVGPRSAVGVFTLDGNGNLINASATSSLNGGISVETFSGTYTVNPDCTGTVTVTIYTGGVATLNLTLNVAFDDSMKHLRGLFTTATLANGTPLATVIALDAARQ